MREPIGVNEGTTYEGLLLLVANKEQSFDGTLTVKVPSLNVSRCSIWFSGFVR